MGNTIIRANLNVDLQNGFCPGGNLPVTEGNLVIPIANALNAAADAKGWETIFSADCHPPDTKHFKEFGGLWPPHCVYGTTDQKFHPDLDIPNLSYIVHKGTGTEDDDYSPFVTRNVEIYQVAFGISARMNYSELDRLLKVHMITDLDIFGLATDYCVKEAVLSARRLGYGVRVIIDACRAVNINPGDGDRAIEEMRAAGAEIVTSTEVLNG